PQWLAEHVLISKWVLAVSGTHGKTTTSSMLAWILECAGKRTGFLIGGLTNDFEVSARASQSPLFVIEADEYDTAFFDKRSKFVHYRPRTALINNIEFDHADIFCDLAAIETQFHHFVRTVPRTGRILVPAADEAVQRVLERGCWCPVETFGEGGMWQGEDTDDRACRIKRAGRTLGELRWLQQGVHNRRNALGAIAAAAHAGVAPEASIEALASFSGVRRRMELRGEVGGIRVYDDFAHHPTAIAATLEGLRAASQPERPQRILAVLEPRSNTMKLGVMKERLAASLAGADQVFCFTQGLGWDVQSALAALGARARCEDDLERLVAAVAAQARAGDSVLVMSNGAFGGIHDKLLAALGGRACGAV
ncbi:MAG: UDP-N-acetylmuramate:L-alanyl-gamma-D-glutamyl-meso-diaminopimelate ligase, partial [Burkholderiales bacterium]|nr:UDP-N-acetylmuramate:L-alanyl-gamma-D-glutamyl-meso-diaminopimelate ligase [Burkholderiales bacterium]